MLCNIDVIKKNASTYVLCNIDICQMICEISNFVRSSNSHRTTSNVYMLLSYWKICKFQCTAKFCEKHFLLTWLSNKFNMCANLIHIATPKKNRSMNTIKPQIIYHRHFFFLNNFTRFPWHNHCSPATCWAELQP